MALSHRALATNLARFLNFNESRRGLTLAAAWAAAASVLVAAPWLWQPGYLFGTDFPGPRRFGWTFSTTSNVPVEAALAAASEVPARIAGRPELGTLGLGSVADVVVLDDRLEIVRVLVAGVDVTA